MSEIRVFDPAAALAHPGFPGRSATLYYLLGAPGSGKTTLAMGMVDADPDHLVRIARDDLRAMLGCLASGIGTAAQEAAITIIVECSVRALLERGWDVIIDATNVGMDAHWAAVAAECGAELEVVDLSHVTADECLRRIAVRVAAGGRDVPEQVVRAMAAQLGRG